MKYSFENLAVQPSEWNKESGKGILQYAVGGLLYMPATTVKIADEIINKRYAHLKSMVLCLEDSIGDDMVGKAEKCLVQILKTLDAALQAGKITINDIPLIFVRIRTPEHLVHVGKLVNPFLHIITGFVFPKFDMTNCGLYIENFNNISEKASSDLYMMPIIESKNAMYRQLRMENLLKVNDNLRLVNCNVLNIRVGCADFCNIFGIRRNITQSVHDIAVINDCLSDIINVFGRNYVVSSGVWEYFGKDDTVKSIVNGVETEVDAPWLKGLKRELRKDKLNGFIGKTCIHPTQLRWVQENLIVSYEDYQDAISIMGIADGLVGVTKGYGGGKMNEVKTHAKWAKKIIGLADVYGVANDLK